MKNVSNPYGYYLTEDFETIELRGNFEENTIFLPTKNPDEQLNYKVFVSPKKNINFGIQIVGGSNPQVVYIPQHIYKELQLAYTQNNPYYTIKDITTVKLDFTDTGNALIKYLTQKFENTTNPANPSKLGSAGVTSVGSYAGFSESGQPLDEDILKQILFLFDEENDVIFVDKDVVMVSEDVVKQRGYGSNRIKGNFTYTSNYFDSAGKFNSPLLNSQANITLENNTIGSISALNDFVKDYAGKSLTEVNSIYKSNISIETLDLQAPKVLGLAIEGLSKVLPLAKGALDKLSQLKAQKAAKKLEEANQIGAVDGVVDSTTEQGQQALDEAKNIFKKPLVPKISAKVPDSIRVKPEVNKFKIKEAGQTLDSATNTISSVSNQTNSAIGKVNSISTISTIGNVSQAEGASMIKNAATSTPTSIKQINADFLKF